MLVKSFFSLTIWFFLTIIPNLLMLSQFQMPKIQWILVHMLYYSNTGVLISTKTYSSKKWWRWFNLSGHIIKFQSQLGSVQCLRLFFLRTSIPQIGKVTLVWATCMFFCSSFKTYKYGLIFSIKAGTFYASSFDFH